MRIRLVGAGLLAAALVFPGCGGKDKKAPDTPKVSGDGAVPTVNEALCDARGKQVETFDLNGDGRPEVWKLSTSVTEGGVTRQVPTCKQSDLNLDGRQDYVVAYTPNGSTDWESFDFDFDGKFDALYLYAPKKDDRNQTQLVEVLRSTRFDGHYDLKEIYDDAGQVEQVQRVVAVPCLGDKPLNLQHKDVQPNVWENYVDGVLVGIMYDDDCDKRPDRREEIELEDEAPATAEAPPGEDEPATDDTAAP
jgi:hypothetical protein